LRGATELLCELIDGAMHGSPSDLNANFQQVSAAFCRFEYGYGSEQAGKDEEVSSKQTIAARLATLFECNRTLASRVCEVLFILRFGKDRLQFLTYDLEATSGTQRAVLLTLGIVRHQQVGFFWWLET
jgi:hypothetical protein